LRVIFAKSALDDLEEIALWIARDSPRRAMRLNAELRAACRGLARYPRRFQLVSRYARREIRRRVHGAYLIFYEIERSEVRIARIIHGARDYEPLLFPDEGPN
jgi:plasmid stabilization system protein ParE